MDDISLGGHHDADPATEKSPMPYLKITENPRLTPRILLLAGFCLIVPAMPGNGPAWAQSLSEITVRQKANAGAVTIVGDLSVTTGPIRVGLSKGMEQAGDDNARQNVAPRLQSRIRKNPEFAAFAKLLQATSKKKYSSKEIKRLYLDFKDWSLKNNHQSQ